MEYDLSFHSLSDLLDPSCYHDPIDISGFSDSSLIEYYRQLSLIRKVENFIAHQRENGSIGGPVHLAVGQEAVPVGISSHLTSSDSVFGAHRSHAHYLSLGCSLRALFSELLGRHPGCSRGMGGSMHLFDKSKAFYGSVPIVAGTVPIALGSALSHKLQNTNQIAISYLGDGAVEEGVVHESLNIASVMSLPILFVVENNLFSSHMHISQRQTQSFVSRFAHAHDISYAILDGNDVCSVSSASSAAISSIRKTAKPFFLECITSRWYGHVDWREDIDVGVTRTSSNLHEWKLRDPILRLEQSLLSSKIVSQEDLALISEQLTVTIDKAWSQAISDPYPPADSITSTVYISNK